MRVRLRPAVSFRAVLAAILVAGLPVPTSRSAQRAVPRFEDYPAIEIFDGQAKPPVLRLPVEQLYRTRLRLGVLNGEGLLGAHEVSNPPQPNFAGAYFAITWGCGSDACAALAVVDARTGRVFGPPPDGDASKSGFVATPRTTDCAGIELHPTSRMIVIDHTEYPGPGESVCQRSYYEWRDQRYHLIGRLTVPAQPH